MPKSFLWANEWYGFGEEHSKELNYILSVDKQLFSPKADWGKVKVEGMGTFHPIAWYQQFDDGRSFYTGLDHIGSRYQQLLLKAHLYE